MFRSILQRLTQPKKVARRQPSRRRLGIETLAKRELLAADLGAIAGTVYVDLAGDGLTGDDTRLEAVEIRLYRDGGDSVFDGGVGDDILVDTVFSAPLAGTTPGEFRFDSLSPGLYFLEQDAATTPAGLVVPDPVPVTVVNDAGLTVATIDALNQTALDLTANAGTPIDTDVTLAPEAIGGVRKAALFYSAGGSDVRLIVLTAANRLSTDAVGGTSGSAIVRYDGDDSAITLVPDGLGGIDLSGGDVGAGILLEIFTDQLGNSFGLDIYTDADNFSTVTVPYPAEALNNTIELFVPFSDFAQGIGATGPADFTSAGAIELSFDISADQNTRVTIFESLQPELVLADLQNFQPITLGDRVFQDTSNEGIFDPVTELGIAGVDVELYQLTGLGDVVDPLTQTPIATATTDGDGIYQFTGVLPGFYAAVIPAREFDSTDPAPGSGTLVDFHSSDPAVPTAGANAKTDNDDDGREVTGQLFVITEAFQLISGSEPGAAGLVNNTVDFGFVGSADLEVEKAFVTLDVAGATRTATFRIDVTNNGLRDATGITLVDTLPAGLTFSSIGSIADANVPPPEVTNTNVVGNVITFDLIDLANGEAVAFLIIVDVTDGATGDHLNTVTVSGDQNDAVPANNTATATLALPETDLDVVKTVETTTGNPIPPATVRTGDTIVYRLVVGNAGPDDATGVVVVDTLPADVTFVSASINGGPAGTGITFDALTGEVTAAVGDIDNGDSAVVLITATVNADSAELISNAATVTNSPNTDPDAANNSSSADADIVRAVDLAVQKALAAGSTAVFGAEVTYEITVTNTATSPGDARGFTVTDTLPAGLTLVPGSFDDLGSGVTLSVAGQVLTFTGVPLAVGESVTFSFDAAIAQGAAASLTNTATLSALNDGGVTDVDIDLDNNEDPETITPARQVDLVVAKDDGIATGQFATPGEEIVYEIIVTNTGVSDAVNVNVTDTLPAGVIATSITVDGGQVTDNNPDQGILSFVLPSVPTGVANAVTVLVTAQIGSAVTGSITNTVTISGGGVGDPAAGNTASVATNVQAVVDVAITKTGPATAVPGGSAISYTLQIVNTGPSAATNVNVADLLPAGLTLQSITLGGVAVTNTGTGNNVAFVIPQVLVGAANAQTAVITATIAPTASGTLENTATITATGDTDTANNTSTLTTTLTPTADIGVTKGVSASAATPGDQLTYTIVVNNTGPSTAQGVTVTDVLPAGVTFVSGTGPGGTALTATGQTVAVNIGALAPAASQTITIIAQIATDFTGTLSNPVTVATTTGEGANTAANTATATTQVTLTDPNSASISGRVFVDANNNGIFEAGDSGVAGLSVNLLTAGTSTVVQTTTTDAQGLYQFSGLAAGSYDVRVIRPPGLLDGLENPGDSRPVSNLGDSTIGNLTLGMGQSITSNDFGVLEAVSKRRFLASSA